MLDLSILLFATAAAAAATFPSQPAVEAYARRNYFYTDGKYINAARNGETAQYLVGQVYVEQLVPLKVRYEVPLLFIAGLGQSGTNWLNTPDGREGWASFFLRQGYIVYLADQAQRGRSPWLPDEGNMSQFSATLIQEQFTAPQDFPSYPQAINHTQWPGSGRIGDPIFDAFMKSQLQVQTDTEMQAMYNNLSFTALLDEIGPVIVVPHSEGCMHTWQLGDARPELVKAIVALEPLGPPFADYGGPPFSPEWPKSSSEKRPYGITILPLHYNPPVTNASQLTRQYHPPPSPDLAPCTLQKDPARRLTHLSQIPTLMLTTQASYHAVYDYCTAEYFKQGGVDVEWIHLPNVGIYGNGHFMFLERNSFGIARFVEPWIAKIVRRK
ncbi:hypothetical protein M409DRAFT_68742 [Zasmidium cellare ATCC 36951]|uniref:Uncharacterized protein n=1 Tax=Zasmidium cellare ATCC 36951 TaxID=1080233 RepID=A0A6A6CB33_ZASCE|nr:uncharacterized protein M409DRAFT_68742 [Zasmidium cellare ATCC 36951]KAF2163122.1 hypothetical protein M409DRAFT_68742 [Zasmidium cellare ATCC 36951]